MFSLVAREAVIYCATLQERSYVLNSLSSRYGYEYENIFNEFIKRIEKEKKFYDVQSDIQNNYWNFIEKVINQVLNNNESIELLKRELWNNYSGAYSKSMFKDYEEMTLFVGSYYFYPSLMLKPQNLETRFKEFKKAFLHDNASKQPSQNNRENILTNYPRTTKKYSPNTPHQDIKNANKLLENHLRSLFNDDASLPIIKNFTRFLLGENLKLQDYENYNAMSKEQLLNVNDTLMKRFIQNNKLKFAKNVLSQLNNTRRLKSFQDAGIFSEIDTEMTFEPLKMKNRFEQAIKELNKNESLAMEELKIQLDRKLPNCLDTNNKFISFLDKKLPPASVYENYKNLLEENVQNFFNVNDKIMNEFIRKFKAEKIQNVTQLMKPELKDELQYLASNLENDSITLEMMFDSKKMKDFLINAIKDNREDVKKLVHKFNRKMPSNEGLYGEFAKYKFAKNVTDKQNEQYLENFIDEIKLQKVKAKLESMENIAPFSIEKNTELLNEIDLELLYDDQNLENHLRENIGKHEKIKNSKEKLEEVMKNKFQNSKSIMKFIDFLSEKFPNNYEVFENYSKNIELITDLNDGLIKEFYDENLLFRVKEALGQNNHSFEQVKSLGIMNEVNITHLFKPKMLEDFLNRMFCEKKVSQMIVSISLDRTLSKCIINEACINTKIVTWSDYKANQKVRKYNRPEKLNFDEADDIFLSILANAVEEKDKELDKNCFVAFFKREQKLIENYNIDMISDDNAFNKFYKTILEEYKKI